MPAGEIWLIANHEAGGGRGTRYAILAGDILADAGLRWRLVHPLTPAGTVQAARDGVAAGASAVIACGGDGTVHGVLQGMAGSEVPFGVLASGSGDDIAGTLGFPVGDARAGAAYVAGAVQRGSTVDVDLGHVVAADGTQRHFLGVLSTGFDSAVNERANTMPRLGGQRYNVAIVRELASFRPATFEVVLDDEVIAGEAMLVAVGNGSSYGGGMRICPAAVRDDGMLDVTWLDAVSKFTFLRSFPSVFKGTHVDNPFVRTFTGRRLSISARGQIAYADGERVGPLPITVESRPCALRVLSG